MSISPYIIPGLPRMEPTIDNIKELVCRHYEITAEELISATRKRHVTIPRQLAMYITKKLKAHMANKTIAMHFGLKDHTNVQHAIEQAQNYIDTEPETKELIERILKQLR